MGKRPQLDLGEITFGRVVSSDSSGGITFNSYFVETNTIVLRRNYMGRVVLSDSSGGHL